MIIAIETSEHNMINRILNKLIDADVVIKAIPSMYDILTGRVRMSSILGTPLISVSQSLMPAWQANVKSFLDYTRFPVCPYHYTAHQPVPDGRRKTYIQGTHILQP